MRHIYIYSLLVFLGTLIAVSCNEVPTISVEKTNGDSLKENLINANRLIAKNEEGQINAYIARRGWQMTRLEGGARVQEFEKGNGRKIDYDDTVIINYDVRLIDGKTAYRNCCDTVIAGRLKPNRGVDAALLTLSHGSKAHIIMPSEQGFGVVGDGDRIGQRMILIYDLKVK